MIAIVDYGAGNLASVKKALDHLGCESVVTASPEVVAKASRVILPGVGHFSATAALASSGLRAAIEQAIARGRPFLGICVGLQWMFAGSAEAPQVPGLGIFAGECEGFPTGMKSPHVGWNTLQPRRPSRLLSGLPPEAYVYYSHSYHPPESDSTVAVSNYGVNFAAAVERDSVFGVQFHPEKSGAAGLQVLGTFCRMPC